MRGARLERGGGERSATDAARKRAVVEMIAHHEQALKRTARRFSLDAEDADDAYQRALEIVLTKAPTTDQRELIRWTQTVTRHEAMAVRESRERLLGFHSSRVGAPDPLASVPAEGGGPGEQAERREAVARTREALLALKPAELRALSLLASGYSYVEIGEITGFSRTKINRVLAEGRNRFRALVSSSEDGTRCRELRPLLSAFCDGEASPADAATVREHLRACARCRSTMRTYRAAPGIAAVLGPALPSRSLLERVHDSLAGLASRLPGMGGSADSATQAAAAGGARGAGVAALAKLLAVCAGAAGGAAACVATGVLPDPLPSGGPPSRPALERPADRPAEASAEEAVEYEPAPAPEPQPQPPAKQEPKGSGEKASAQTAAAPAGAIEYEAPPPPVEAPPPSAGESAAPNPSSGSAAGEFGP